MICLISHKINAKYVIIFQTRNTAMGIRKKIQQQFYFYFCCRKGQIQQHYNGKNF